MMRLVMTVALGCALSTGAPVGHVTQEERFTRKAPNPRARHLVNTLQTKGLDPNQKPCQNWDPALSMGYCAEGDVKSGAECTTVCASSELKPTVAKLTCVDGSFIPAGFACEVPRCQVPRFPFISEEACFEVGYGAGGIPTGGACTLKCGDGRVAVPGSLTCLDSGLSSETYECVEPVETYGVDAPAEEVASGVVCEANSYADLGSETGCAPCPPGSKTVAPGVMRPSDCVCDTQMGYEGGFSDDGAGGCIPIACEKDQYVLNHTCTDCPGGTFRLGGDLATGEETACGPVSCEENFRVLSNECVACEPGKVNIAGDRANLADSTCATVLCVANQFVASHVCVDCPGGQVSATDTAATSNDTSCTLCPKDTYRSIDMDACGPCPPHMHTVTDGGSAKSSCVCNDGFEPKTGEFACVPLECECDNGTPANDASLCSAVSPSLCQACDAGFTLNHNFTRCEPKACDCENGVGTSGSECTGEIGAMANCSSCDAGYLLIPLSGKFGCAQVECPNGEVSDAVCTCGSGYTGGGAWNGTGYGDCVKFEQPCLGAWSLCDVSCSQNYNITTEAAFGGAECFYEAGSIRYCSGGRCKTPAEDVSCAGSWSGCSADCKRTFSVSTPQSGHGQPCASKDGDTVPCYGGECASGPAGLVDTQVPCAGAWSVCGAGCDQTFSITTAATNGGAACKYADGEARSCLGGQCLAPPAQLSCDGSWSQCSATCTQRYTVERSAQNGGAPCPFGNQEERFCTGNACMAKADQEQPCMGEWGECGVSCTRTFQVTQVARGGGVECPVKNGELRACMGGSCAPTNWNEATVNCDATWSGCDAACVNTQTVVRSGLPGITACGDNGDDMYCSVGQGLCHNRPVPVDCQGAWTECSSDCEKTFLVSQAARMGGVGCAAEHGAVASCKASEGLCTRVPTAVDCKGELGQCSTECKQHFWVTTQAKNGGKPCQHASGDELECQDCRQGDCQGQWSTCTPDCISRYTITTPQFTGAQCPFADMDVRACAPGQGLCPEACGFGKYADAMNRSVCHDCPPNTITLAEHSAARSDCKCDTEAGYEGQIPDDPQMPGGCAPVVCGESEYVYNHTCVPCYNGTTREGNDDATGPDTECKRELCFENERVLGQECVPCEPGTVNSAGDVSTGGDTECTTKLCGADENVVDFECVPCGLGWQAPADTPATTNGTSCTVCPKNSYRGSEDIGCVECPPNSESSDGPRRSSITDCSCIAGFFQAGVDAGSCTINTCTCSDGTAAEGTDCPKNGDEGCTDCNVGYHLEGAMCVQNQCVCAGGTGDVGILCVEHGSPSCGSCDDGFEAGGPNFKSCVVVTDAGKKAGSLARSL